ncbi:hypothetical protein ACLK1T_11755 [Escherichia coli]
MSGPLVATPSLLMVRSGCVRWSRAGRSRITRGERRRAPQNAEQMGDFAGRRATE